MERAAAPEGCGAGAKSLRTGLEPVIPVDGGDAVHMARGHPLTAKGMVDPAGVEPASKIGFISDFLHG